MHNEFQKLGIPVSITRNTDTTLSPSKRTKKYYLFTEITKYNSNI